ncbi:uncharacterized protein LOC110026457 isoform X2 [Phalaenopsis equestris]|uniref:uncharacterized protein LOC110026457 isoform X2 n=1 Tax=Phalaenopsis equestris TaxID=78828 RepID=UPI0009E1CF86|nr:uncharacterized protein LOC110026457 isoform X2 [Phalaenopsis equestris]
MEERRKKKKKKQQMPLSSSRRENTPGNPNIHSKKPIGCFSGILQLLSRHHSRRRISAKKEKIEIPPATSNPTLPQPDFTKIKTAPTPEKVDLKFSGEGNVLSLRSPTLSPEIRRSGECFDCGENQRRPPAIVARLMGLEESSPQQQKQSKISTAFVDGFTSDSAEEKRRRLLGALERCNEDLRALKRIIDAVRSAEMIGVKGGRDSPMQGMKCLEGNSEQPSPVSVLDGLASPKNDDLEKKVWSSTVMNLHLPRRITIEGIPRLLSDHKRMLMDQARPIDSSPAATKSFASRRWRRRWRSNAMVKCVGEVAEDVVCEERKELVRVGMDLAEDVIGELVGQLVVELVESCSMLCLRTVRCKRKLCF